MSGYSRDRESIREAGEYLIERIDQMLISLLSNLVMVARARVPVDLDDDIQARADASYGARGPT